MLDRAGGGGGGEDFGADDGGGADFAPSPGGGRSAPARQPAMAGAGAAATTWTTTSRSDGFLRLRVLRLASAASGAMPSEAALFTSGLG